MRSAPPIAPLRRLVRRLEHAGVTCALGGSGLLAALGIEDVIGDWDLTTDDPLEQVRRALGRTRHEAVEPSGIHADHKLQLRGGEIEIIVGFAFKVASGTVRIPTWVAGLWRGVPVGSPESWAVAYWLLERPKKSQALFRLLETRGVAAAIRDRLLAEPLPADLAARLAGLPVRGSDLGPCRPASPE